MAFTSDEKNRMIAATELVGRTGATGLEIAYLHDDVPSEEAGWYAAVQYKGSRILVEDHVGPVQALDALVERLLTGARCHHCKGLVALTPFGATAFNGHLVDGSEWSISDAAKAPQCLWRRAGARWIRGCEGNQA
jgi:hypothetical protein